MFGFLKKKPDAFLKVEASEFAELMKKPNHVLLDVRSPTELDSGTIPGSIMIDYLKVGFKSKLAKLDKSKTYLVYCFSGPRSLQTCRMLKKMGFESVFHLEDGIVAWFNLKSNPAEA